MSSIFEIRASDIENLGAGQLVKLLSYLVQLDIRGASLEDLAVSVPENITSMDDGIDGFVSWKNGPDSIGRIPNRHTVFQCKAGKHNSMTRKACKKEILRSRGKLKSSIQEMVENDGDYVLSFTTSCSDRMKKDRKEGFLEAFAEAGIEYDSDKIHVFDANNISEWVNEYFSVQIYVLRCLGRAGTEGMIPWDEWTKYKKHQSNYVFDSLYSEQIDEIWKNIAKPKTVIRVTGLPGTGKTRLVMEAFRPKSDTDFATEALSKSVVYCDAQALGSNLILHISSLRPERLASEPERCRSIIIVDNCNTSLRKLIADEITHEESDLSLITIDSDVEDTTATTNLIHLTGMQENSILGMLIGVYAGLSESAIRRIAKFAEGFPLMARLLAEANLSGSSDVVRLDDLELVKRMIWGSELEDPIALKVIESCSVFAYFGFEKEVGEEVRFIARCLCPQMDFNDFYGTIIGKFSRRGIIEFKGRFAHVVPQPLAITLAARWWEKQSPEMVERLFSEVVSYPKLAENLCIQMSRIGFSKHANEFVEKLCAPQAPFGQLEVLSSKMGSQLFQVLVEVNPKATLKATKRVFGALSYCRLIEIRDNARRNLVRALTKLVFFENSFSEAANLLFRFAVAENEKWANNATGVFLQLFHVYLPGTSVDLQQRLLLLRELSEKKSESEIEMVIKALGGALLSRNFSGLPIETSGAIKRDEIGYKPKTYAEIYEYWNEVLQLIKSFAVDQGENATKARSVLLENVGSFLLSKDLFKKFSEALKEILVANNGVWIEAYRELREAKQLSRNISDAIKKSLDDLIELLEPQDFGSKLRSIVCIPPWYELEESDNERVDLVDERARAFASECFTEKGFELLIENIEVLFDGEQRKGYIFGHELGANLSEDKIRELATKYLAVVKALSPAFLDLRFFGGFLASTSPRFGKIRETIVERIFEDADLVKYVVQIISFIKPAKKELEMLMAAIDNGSVSSDGLATISYGKNLNHLDFDELCWFSEEVSRLLPEKPTIAFEVLYMYCLKEESLTDKCTERFERLLIQKDYLLKLLKPHQGSRDMSHAWADIVKKLIDKGDKWVSENILRQIVSYAKASDSDSFGSLDVLYSIVEQVIQGNFASSWPIVWKELQSRDFMERFRIKQFLTYGSRYSSSESILSKVNPEALVEWIDSHPSEAPEEIAELIDPVSYERGVPQWHPVALHILSTYGDQEDVRRSIYFSLGPFSLVGSLVPYIRNKVKAFEMLKELVKKPVIHRWSENEIESLKKEIEREARREEEQDLL